MRAFVAVETSRPSGQRFRLAFGVELAPMLVWIALGLARLF